MALLGVVKREIQSALSESKGLGSDSRASLIERHHSVFESATLSSAEQLAGRYATLLEVSFVDRYATNSHEVFAFTDLESGCTALNDKAGYAASPTLWIDGGEDREEVGGACVGSPLLVAINDVVVAVAMCLGF